jgi:hypothetical protein
MNEKQFDADEIMGNEENCYRCQEKPAVTLKQIQEWEYRDEERENEKIKTTIFLCKDHHNLMINKGEEML